MRKEYIDHLLGYINVANLKPLKLVINSGNGAAGPVVDAPEARFKALLNVPVTFVKVHNLRMATSRTVSRTRCCQSAATTPAMR